MDEMNVLELARLEKGLSIRELAKAAHISPATIQRIESGQVIPEKLTVFRLANALQVEAKTLLQLTEGMSTIGVSNNAPNKNEGNINGTYQPDPDELADLLEVVARSQKDGPGARVSLTQVTAIIEKQISDFKANNQRQSQPEARRQAASA